MCVDLIAGLSAHQGYLTPPSSEFLAIQLPGPADRLRFYVELKGLLCPLVGSGGEKIWWEGAGVELLSRIEKA